MLLSVYSVKADFVSKGFNSSDQDRILSGGRSGEVRGSVEIYLTYEVRCEV